MQVVKRTNPPQETKDRHCYWLCKCKCGNQVVVVGTSLINGQTKSCGCLRKNKIIDLTGKKFGFLTVIEIAKNPTENNTRDAYWLCECKCGNRKIINGKHLRMGLTKSCGCYKKTSDYLYKNSGIFKKQYNSYDLSGEYGIGYTSNGEEFYFDLEDYDKIKDYCWSFSGKDKYVSNSKHHIRMHRLLMNCNDENLVVDHINHITYDNRKKNLRVCTLSQNGMNKNKPSNNTSGYTGITYNPSSNKWRVRIGVDNKTINIGKFTNIDKAIEARKQAEEKYFKEYSYDKSIEISNGGM